jgi:hypothetical protein
VTVAAIRTIAEPHSPIRLGRTDEAVKPTPPSPPLDVDQATLPSWVRDAERAEGLRGPTASRGTDSEKVGALKWRVAELA